MDNYGITTDTTYISVGLAHHEIVCAKVGKGGIILYVDVFTPTCHALVYTNVERERERERERECVCFLHSTLLKFMWLSVLSVRCRFLFGSSGDNTASRSRF